MERMCSMDGDCTGFQPPFSFLSMSLELWQVAAAWRTSMATFWRLPVFISWMSVTATPTPARMLAVVSPILKRAEKTGSLPLMVTSPAAGIPRPRIFMTSSNPGFMGLESLANSLKTIVCPALHHRAGLFRVDLLDAVSGPAGQHADGRGRSLGCVLREGAAAHHEQVRHVPGLQVLVDHAGRGVGSHHRAADVVRALVGDDAVLRLDGRLVIVRWLHRF